MITMSWTISPSKSGNLAYRCSSCLQVLLPLDMFMLFNIFCFYTFCWTSSSELYRWTVLTRFSKLIIPLSFDIFISYCLRPAFLYPEYKESMHSGRWAHRPNLTRSSVACSDREYFYSPLDGLLVHRKVTPSSKFTWVKKGTVKVNCLAQEHDAAASARTRTTPVGVHVNH